MTENEHVNQESREREDQPAIRDRPVNPFIAGAPVSGPEMFYGRDDVFEFIQRNLIGRHHDTPIVLKGERRTGKTSVLYQVHRHLDPAYRCVSIDLHGLSLNGIGDLLNGIATSVSNSLRSDYAIAIDPPDRSAFDADPRSAFESVFLDAVLAALGEDHLVLMLDEVVRLDDKVRAGQLEPEVFGYLRHLMQHHPRLNFIFSLGSGLEEMQKDYAFLFSPTLYHRISFLEEAAARKLITEPVREHYEMSPDAVDTILQVTSRHPYYTQLVCQSLFDRWSSRPPKPVITAEDVYAALSDAIERGSPNLTYVWEDSSPEEKAVMAAMAAATRTGRHAVTGKATRDTWRKTCGPLPDRKLSSALRSLASREVITGVEAYSFSVDLQRLWLDKHRRLDWVKDELAEPIQQWTHDTRTHRTRYLAVLAALILVLGYLGLGRFATHWWPFGSGLAAAENSLIRAMPGDLSNHPGDCHALNPAPRIPWPHAPVPEAILRCTNQELAGAVVLGYLFDSVAHYKTAWASFNTWWDSTSIDGGSCTQKGAGRVLLTTGGSQQEECGFPPKGRHVLEYAWSVPSENGLIVAQSASDTQSSYAALSQWVMQLHPLPTAAAATGKPKLPAGVTPITEVLPHDILDFATGCATLKSVPFAANGLVTALSCVDPGLPGGAVYAFQADSTADYQAMWLNYNQFAGFYPSGAGATCPPLGSQVQGITPWKPGGQAEYKAGQVLECGSLGSGSTSQVVYIWTYPEQNAFMIAQGGYSINFEQMDYWLRNNA